MGGAQEVVRQLSTRLAARGHEITVATSALPGRTSQIIDGVDIRTFAIRGNEVRGMHGDLDGYRRFVTGGGFDVVMTYAAQQWTTDALLGVLDAIDPPTVLAPCGFSGLHNAAYASYFAHMRDDLHRFDALVFHSDTYQDIRFAREAGVPDPVVIPNGADEGEFERLPPAGRFRAAHRIPAERTLLLTVGGHTGLKGHAEAMATLRASATATTLAIVGNRPTGRSCLPTCRARALATSVRRPGARVLLTDPPRPRVLEAYADADLFIFCSMVECSPLVLFEAMAAGLPFVSSDVGNAREIAEWGGGGVVVESARRADGLVEADSREMAAAVDGLLADHDRHGEMARRARESWREWFTWDAVTDRYEELYTRLTG